MKNLKKYLLDFANLACGALCVFAFAPFNASWLLLPALTISYALWWYGPRARSYWRGFLFGLGFFGAGVSWVYVSIHIYGATPAPLAVLFTLLFVATLAIFPGFHAYIFKYWQKEKSALQNSLLFASVGSLVEIIRSKIFTGFPWLLLGYSQQNGDLAGYIPILGVFGTGFIVLLCAALFFHTLHLARRCLPGAILCLFIALIFVGGAQFAVQQSWTHSSNDDTLKVALLQGNIAQSIKWSPEYLNKSLQTYQNLINTQDDADLIVLPEAAIPLPLHLARKYINQLDETAEKNQQTLILGLPIQNSEEDNYFNSLLSLGAHKNRYDKTHLVPFGEYLPFAWLRGIIDFFDLPMSDFIAGQREQDLLQADGFMIAPFICYEIAYSDKLRAFTPHADLLLTATNDAWFGDSWAPAQHLQIAQTRSLQSGRPGLFVANDGITAVISEQGQVIAQLPRYQTASLRVSLHKVSGNTPWVRYGNMPIFIAILLCLLLAIARASWHANNKK